MADSKAPQFGEKQPLVPDYQPFDTGSLLTPWTSFYKPPADMGLWGDTLNDIGGMGVYGELENLLMGSYGKSARQQMRLSPQIADIDIANWQKAQQAQLAMAPSISATNLAAQQAQQAAIMRQWTALNAELSPQIAATEWANNQKYMPQYGQMYRDISDLGAPGMRQTYENLGGRINEGLAAGYSLGPDLQREIEQSIRGAQDARGVYLGAAPTAEEAYGKGKNMVDLYNTRMQQAQNYVQGKTPMDLWGAASTTRVNQPAPAYFGQQQNLVSTQPANLQPSVNPQVAAGIGPTALQGYQNAYDTMLNSQNQYNNVLTAAQTPYNSALLTASNQNNNWMFEGYDRVSDAWRYNEAVKQGLYSVPSTGSSMGGAGSMIGSGLSAIGGLAGSGLFGGGGAAAAGTTLAGTGIATAGAGLGGAAGAAGGIGGALAGVGGAIGGAASAVGGGIAAAVSAAGAAFCWVAQKAIPNDWKKFRRWLCTKASPEFRRWYIFNGRKVAHNLDSDAIKLIAPLMLALI